MPPPDANSRSPTNRYSVWVRGLTRQDSDAKLTGLVSLNEHEGLTFAQMLGGPHIPLSMHSWRPEKAFNELSKRKSVEESGRAADKAVKHLIPATESTISAVNQVRPNWGRAFGVRAR